MMPDTKRLEELAGRRLSLQSSYEPKRRRLVETRTMQLGFEESERAVALRSMDALVWKMTAAGIHLERLWENRESFDMQQLISRALRGDPEPKRFTDKETAFLTAEFEAFVLQARAFISVAQVHTLDACRVPFGGQLTNKAYEKAVRKAAKDVSDRLTHAHNYFTGEVFGQGKWGSLLKSLRDRAVHFDRTKPTKAVSSEGSEELTVAGLSLDRLAQDFENGVYAQGLEPTFDIEQVPEETQDTLRDLGYPQRLHQTIGAALAQALLADEKIAVGLEIALGLAEAARQPLPVELRFGGGSDALAALPWELLYHSGRFLVADTSIALTRYPEGAIPPTRAMADLPMRVLLVLSEPAGASPIFLHHARQELLHGLRTLDEAGPVVVGLSQPGGL